MPGKFRFCSRPDVREGDIRVVVCIDCDAVTSYTSQGSKNKTVLFKFGAPSIWWALGVHKPTHLCVVAAEGTVCR